MSSIREEIKALNRDVSGQCIWLNDVLAIIDRHESDAPSTKPVVSDSSTCTRHKGCREANAPKKPSDERPAREALKIVLVPKEDVSPLNWSDDTQSMAICTRAIVEAIDANTAAQREQAPAMQAVVDNLMRELSFATGTLEGVLMRNKS